MRSRDACLPSPFESWESAQAPPQPARLFRCLTCLNTKLCHLRGSLVKVFAASGIGQINRATHVESFFPRLRNYFLTRHWFVVIRQKYTLPPASQLVSSYSYAMCRTATASDLHLSQRFPAHLPTSDGALDQAQAQMTRYLFRIAHYAVYQLARSFSDLVDCD